MFRSNWKNQNRLPIEHTIFTETRVLFTESNVLTISQACGTSILDGIYYRSYHHHSDNFRYLEGKTRRKSEARESRKRPEAL